MTSPAIPIEDNSIATDKSAQVLNYLTRLLANAALSLLLLALVFLLFQYRYNPLLQTYIFFDQALAKRPPDSSLTEKYLENRAAAYLAFARKFEKKSANESRFKRVSRAVLPEPLARQLLSPGINRYHLLAKEKTDWNFHLQDIFASRKNIVLKMENGWLKPHFGEEFPQNPQSSDDLLSSELVRRYHSPEVFYFSAPNRQAEPISAIYLAAGSLREKNLDSLLYFASQNPVNAVVFDIKDVTGLLTYQSSDQQIQQVQKNRKPEVADLARLVQHLKENGLYTIARIAMFQDNLLGSVYPQLVISQADGSPLLSKGVNRWVDPSLPEVQDYNLKIIWEVLQAGVDEIQLDYIRYPAESNWRHARYRNILQHEDKPLVLSAFLQKAHALTRSNGSRLSIDVFGVTAWQEKADLMSTGQNLHILAQSTDIIAPMLYPSHFNEGFNGIARPADAPFFFISEGTRKVKSISGPGVEVRPWLQAFSLDVSHYNSQYIEEQIRGSFAGGAHGYMLWNSRNSYKNFDDKYFHPTK